MDLYKEHILFAALAMCFFYAQYLMIEIMVRKKTLKELKKTSLVIIYSLIFMNLILLLDFILSDKYEFKMFLSLFSFVNIIEYFAVIIIYKTKRIKIINNTNSISLDESHDSDFNRTEDLEDLQTVGDNGFEKTQFFKKDKN